MSEKKIKVTDKRLFTADGELREEYRDLAEAPASRAVEVPSDEKSAAGSPQVEAPATEPSSAEPIASGAPSTNEVEPGTSAAPSFYDLVAAVAQPIALYLGDVKMPDGESMENLPLARLHIDLLEILQVKSAGNLTEQESGFLEDLLYQLRLRYVEKRGKA